MDRKAFNFYASFDETARDLNDKQFSEFMRVLLDVQFMRVHIDKVIFTDKIVELLWKANKHSIKKQLEGYCSVQKISYNSLFVELVSAPKGGTKVGTKVQEEGQVKGQDKDKGDLLTPLRFINISLLSTKDNNIHSPRRALNQLENKYKDDFEEDEVLTEIVQKFVEYRDEMYSSSKDKKYGIKTMRSIVGFINEITEVNDPYKAFEIMEANEWATFKREWVKGSI